MANVTNLSSIDDFSIVVLNDSSPIGSVESKNSASVVVEEAGEENT